ncbi:MAG: radical SAM protein [Luteitalea sp.]|nr:radical SAM protein [Luteitalea sp.]
MLSMPMLAPFSKPLPRIKLGSSPDRLLRLAHLRPQLAGHVDRVEAGTLIGWAADLAHPGRRVAVECCHNGRPVASAVANEFRQDVEAAGIGDGVHGFTCVLPDDCADIPNLRISVRVRGTQTALPHHESYDVAVDMREFLWFIATDIVNNCNLRCPFCVVDYSAVKATQLMTEGTYRSLLRLIQCVPDGNFYLSCLHEPTLHPRLNQFLELIPVDARKKAFFTTNLARPLKEADFHAWAHSGLHHINVSLDTLDADRFAVLRKFGRLDAFRRNLNLLAEVFRRTPGAPLLRYITMAFRSNFEEIPEIVRYSREHWLASENEIRYTFNVAHITDDFRRQEYLHKEDWEVLTERLHRSGYPVRISYPPEDDEQKIPAQNYYEFQEPTGDPSYMRLFKPLGLRARPDGTILVGGAEDALRVNITALKDPVRFFRAVLKECQPR